MNNIKFVRIVPKLSYFPIEQRFEVKSTGRKTRRILAALQARKAIAPAMATETYQMMTIDTNSVVERIFTMKADLQRYFSRDAHQLLIGAKDFYEMMGTNEMRHHDIVRLDTKVRSNWRVLDLEIVIVPWMTGMVVMP